MVEETREQRNLASKLDAIISIFQEEFNLFIEEQQSWEIRNKLCPILLCDFVGKQFDSRETE